MPIVENSIRALRDATSGLAAPQGERLTFHVLTLEPFMLKKKHEPIYKGAQDNGRTLPLRFFVDLLQFGLVLLFALVERVFGAL